MSHAFTLSIAMSGYLTIGYCVAQVFLQESYENCTILP